MLRRVWAALRKRADPENQPDPFRPDDLGPAVAPDLLGLLREALAAEAAGRQAEADRLYALAAERDAQGHETGSAAQHFYTRGLIHLRDQRIARARFLFSLAHRLLPGAAPPLAMRGFCGYFDGDIESGRRDYDQAVALATPAERGLMRINRLIDTLPQVAASAQQLFADRAWFASELAALLADPPEIGNPLREIHRTMFYLCYQGANDRELNSNLARLFLACTPSLAYEAPHTRTNSERRAEGVTKPLRIGIASFYLNRHSVGAWYNEFVRRLIASGRFECVLFTLGAEVDGSLLSAVEAHGRLVVLEPSLESAREKIGEQQLDVLVYTDVGMHPLLYFLSMSRLARVQALLVGHPCTSGVPTMDYFISNQYQDAEEAADHYSERLVRLSQIPVYVKKTPPPARRLGRAELGWLPGVHYYLCPMMLQKMHPDFDWALAAILRADPHAELVLFADREHALWQEKLSARFAREMPDVADRIDFRPFAAKDEFLSLLLEADCVLDPFHFSGGVTTYIALSLGVPVVTLPGTLFRSRMTAGMYMQAGCEDAIAQSREHYVELALAFAREPERRKALGDKIVSAHARLFETDGAVSEFADWLESVA